jgi:hypothetical protein
MNIALFDKEGTISTSPVYFAYLVLRIMKKRRTDVISIFSLGRAIKQYSANTSLKQLFYGIMILKMAGIVEVDDIYLRVVKDV